MRQKVKLPLYQVLSYQIEAKRAFQWEYILLGEQAVREVNLYAEGVLSDGKGD